jgi:plasmid stabilization system protein ParE
VLPVVFGPAARAELIQARDWYGARDVELAARFTAEVEMARCRRFPYALFFRIVDGTVHVVACFHSSRDPHQWQRRG